MSGSVVDMAYAFVSSYCCQFFK